MSWHGCLHVLGVGSVGEQVASALTKRAMVTGTSTVECASSLSTDLIVSSFEEVGEDGVVLLVGPSMMHALCAKVDDVARGMRRRWSALIPEPDVLRAGPFLDGEHWRYSDFLEARLMQASMVRAADAHSQDQPDHIVPGLTMSQVDLLVALWLRAAAEPDYPEARVWLTPREDLDLQQATLVPSPFPRSRHAGVRGSDV